MAILFSDKEYHLTIILFPFKAMSVSRLTELALYHSLGSPSSITSDAFVFLPFKCHVKKMTWET